MGNHMLGGLSRRSRHEASGVCLPPWRAPFRRSLVHRRRRDASRSKRSSKMLDEATAPPFAESATIGLSACSAGRRCVANDADQSRTSASAPACLNGSFLNAVVSQYLGERAVGAVIGRRRRLGRRC